MTDDDLPGRESPAPGDAPLREAPAREDGEVSAFGAGPRVRRRGHDQDAVPTPVRKGTTAALAMFAVAVAAELGALAWVALSGAGPEQAANAFLGVGGMLVAIFLFAAPAVALSLPKPERRSFWATGVICAFLGFILWGVTCGLAAGIGVAGIGG
jgi:hypothetical protein